MHLSAKMTTAIRPRTHEQLKLKNKRVSGENIYSLVNLQL